MVFDIINEASATFAPQAAVDSTDIDIIVAAAGDNGVFTGCAVTAQSVPNMTIQVSAGTVYINGSSVAVSSVSSLAIGAAGASDRKDMIVVNNAGTVSVVAGGSSGAINGVTSSGGRDPVKGAVPANSVALAEVYVATTTTSVASTNITDKRITVLQTVTIDTTQTISGAKTFSSTVTVSSGDVAISSGVASFGATTRQMVNLFNATYGFGVQSSTLYYRANSLAGHAWFSGGTHSNTQNDPGSGGVLLMTLSSSGLLGLTGGLGSGGYGTASLATALSLSDTVASTSGTVTNLPGRLSMSGTYWTGAASATATAYQVLSITDSSGSTQMNYVATNHNFTGTAAFSGLLTTSGGITVPSGQALTTGTRTVVTGTRAVTTNASDAVDLGTFSTTGGAIELRLHAHLAAPGAGTTASVTKVYEFAANATMGTVSTWYTVVPADSSQAQASTNDFDLEANRTGTNTFSLRFRQKTIGVAGTITFTCETLGDTAVTFTPSTTITAAPAAATNYHPSNPVGMLAGDVSVADGSTLRSMPRGTVYRFRASANGTSTSTTNPGTALYTMNTASVWSPTNLSGSQVALVNGRRYRSTVTCHSECSVITGSVHITMGFTSASITAGSAITYAAQIADMNYRPVAATVFDGRSYSMEFSVAASGADVVGGTYYTVIGAYGTVAGTVTVFGSASLPSTAQILIEDIGSA